MMGINITDFRDLIIVPTLDELAKAEPRINSDAAVALLLGTALCESELTFLRQRVSGGFGPAISLFQIEPDTHKDVKRYLNERRPDLAKRVFGLSTILDPDGFELASNMPYSVAIARVKYWTIRAKLPDANDIEGMADYWGEYYQTSNDPEKIKRFIDFYQRYVEK